AIFAHARSDVRRVASGVTPTNRLTAWPLRNTRKVGTEVTPYLPASGPLVSMLTLQTLWSRARASTTGFIARHGGHQEAQKSTSTGPGDSSTSVFQLNSSSNMTCPPPET